MNPEGNPAGEEQPQDQHQEARGAADVLDELVELLQMATGGRIQGNSFPRGFTGSANWLVRRLGLRQEADGTSEERDTRIAPSRSRRELARRASRRGMTIRQFFAHSDGWSWGDRDDDDNDDDDEDEDNLNDGEGDEDSAEDDGEGSSGGSRRGGGPLHRMASSSGHSCRDASLHDHPLGHLIRCRSAPSEDSTRLANVKLGSNVNVCTMLTGREMNVSGNGKFSTAERCHVSSKLLPTDGPTVVENMHSRAYTGQFSGDGSLFVAGFQDQRIRIYNVERNWTVQKDILARNLRWTVTDTALSPDHRFLIYASITPLVHLVNVGSEAGGVQSLANITDIHEGLDFGANPRLECRAFGIWSLQFSQDGSEIVAGTSDRSIYVYDLEANKPTLRVEAHKDDVNAVTFADKSSHLIYSGSDDNLCKVWDRRCLAQRSKPVGVLEGHLEGITFIDSFGDGQYFISNSKDQTIKLWDIRKMTSSPARSKSSHIPRYRWDYRWDDYPGRDKRLEHPDDVSLMTYRGHVVLRTLIRCYFSPRINTGQKYIYTGSHDGHVYIYDVLTGRQVQKLQFHDSTVRDVSWHPTQPMLVSSSWDGNIARWDYFHGEKPPSAQQNFRRHRTTVDLFDSD